MRLSEFKRAAQRHLAHSIIVCAPFVCALVSIAIYASFKSRFEAALPPTLHPVLKDLLVVLPMALPTVIALALVLPLSRRVDRKFGVFCPHCAGDVGSFRHIVIVSRNCPHCGARVIDQED